MSTGEKFRYKLFVFEGALDEGDVLKSFEFFGNGRCPLIDMGSDLIPTGPLVPSFSASVWARVMERTVYPTAEATRAREAACRPVALTITSRLFVM